MINRWLNGLNYTILGIIGLLCGSLIYMWLSHSDEIVFLDPKSKQSGLPKGAFEFSPETYDGIAGSFLTLESAPPSLQLPDLKSQLTYNGRNGRPDAQTQNTALHFSLAGNKKILSVTPEEKIYLAFDKNSKPARYNFSPENEKTALWMECSLMDNNEVVVRVSMEDEKGELITEPEAHAQFRMPEKDFVRNAAEPWEIGTWRVDGTLLARQRARWFGHDRFLEKHGGKEYEHISTKQRIDLGENDDAYFVFVELGDCLIWDNNRWRLIKPGEESTKYPLLVVKKVDDRLMSFELWDVDGKGKVALNLLKSNEPWGANNAQTIQQAFKFVGARTRTQCLFEINKERMVIRPSDWLLMTPKGWKKLDSADEIDKFVQRKLTGMLFVFEGWTKKDDRQVMQGTLYNPSRTDCQTVELAAQQVTPKPALAKNTKDKDLDDDDDEEAEELIEKMLSSLSQNKENSAKNKQKNTSAEGKQNNSGKKAQASQKNQRTKK